MKTAEILKALEMIANHEYDSSKRPSENYKELKFMAMDIIDAYDSEKYLQNKDGEYNWLFNWIGGGFNDTWAKTKEEAIAKVEKEREEIKKKYPTHVELKADPKSFRKATQESADAQNRAGWMMSI